MTVYLDNNATTPLDPGVREALFRAFDEEYGNAGSRTHGIGQSAKRAVEAARQSVARLVAANPADIIFTSGATEASNLAILGLEAHGRATSRKHIVTTSIEHKAVLEPLDFLESKGFEVTRLPVGTDGRVQPSAVLDAMRDDTLLVSIMHANNETGIIQPISEIAKTLPPGPFFHVDAAQTFGKLIEPLQNRRIDLISISAHKIYGPKGIGALVSRKRGFDSTPLTPLLHGGGQERGLRPGTLPVPLVAGFGAAADIAEAQHLARSVACEKIKNTALAALATLNPIIIGDPAWGMPNVISVAFPGVDSEALMLAARDIVAMSNGSACTSSTYSRSHVLQAMGLPLDVMDGAVRLSWSHLTGEVPWNELAMIIAQLSSDINQFG